MTTQLFSQQLKENRRDALVAYYIATQIPEALQEKVKTSDDLYEYLLLDTQISDAVKTSPLAEAISSLQLYIHRAMEGYDGPLADTANQYFADEQFLFNWGNYNSRYSIWAGKERLRFYAGNYISPDLRINKTESFKKLASKLSSGSNLTSEVYCLFVDYLNEYQNFKDLKDVIKCNSDINDECYIIARDIDGNYYWKLLSNTIKLADWIPLNFIIKNESDEWFNAYVLDGFLHIFWVSTELSQDVYNKDPIKKFFQNEIKKRIDNTWVLLRKDCIEEGPDIYLRADEKFKCPKKCAWIPMAYSSYMGFLWRYYDEEKRILYAPTYSFDGFVLSSFSFLGSAASSIINAVICNYEIPEGGNVTDVGDRVFYLKDHKLYFEYNIKKGGVVTDAYRYEVSRDGKCTLIKHEAGAPSNSNEEIIKISYSDFVLVKKEFIAADKKSAEIEVVFNSTANHSFPNNYLHIQVEDNGKSVTIKNVSDNIASHGHFPVFVFPSIENSPAIKPGESLKVSVSSNREVVIYSREKNEEQYKSWLLTFYLSKPTAGVWEIPLAQEVFGEEIEFDSGQIAFLPPENSTAPALGFGLPENKNHFDLIDYLSEISDRNLFDRLYDYYLQGDEYIGGGDAFNEHNGIYLWEIFFHIPFLIATRFQTQQNYTEAERWYKYIFNSAGYRDEDGNLLSDDKVTPRYWNCLPLQEDTVWDDSQPASTDPDVIAAADPMHYKLAIFLHTLDLLITRGDAAYRQLEQDTLTEAKMYYMAAQQLLGPRPDIRITNTWPSPVPTLSAEAGAIATPTSASFTDWLRAGDSDEVGDGDFLPPYNDALLDYWDKLEVRLYNLRHNLSLDGQPLNLPLYATPSDPAELCRQQASNGDGVSNSEELASGTGQGWRYPLIAERARVAVGLLTQFGNSLQLALERQDAEKMTLLLQTQQQVVLEQQSSLQQSNLSSLRHNLTAMQASREGATLRQKHFTNLISQGYSADESAALELRSSARKNNIASASLFAAAGAANMAPNVFGLATGGIVWGAVIEGSARGTQIAGMAEEQSAGVSEITASYQRRLEEWQLQRDIAGNEITQWDAQIDSLTEQITMAQKQITLAETERSHAQALYDMQTSRFTGQALYNWLAGRLSALYYQLYDATLPVCLQAKAALSQELGSGNSDMLFRTPVWDNLWQGLLAGEALSVELQKLDNVWLSLAAKGLEATRTVSLAAQCGESTLSKMIASVLEGTASPSPANGVLIKLSEGTFSAELDLSALALENSYNMQGRARFIKSIAVTLPTLLGPYQDIEATLTLGNEVATLSHGMDDNGRFVTNFDDVRFLPFEGADPTTGKLTLNIFNVVKDENSASKQYRIVENMNDIIFRIHYILRDRA